MQILFVNFAIKFYVRNSILISSEDKFMNLIYIKNISDIKDNI